MAPPLVFVHSPLVGSETWAAVADIFRARGQEAFCPDLTSSLAQGPPYWPRQVEAIAQRVASRPVILIGHSGAGALLPAAGHAVGDVEAYVFVDAGLPHPGQSWFETAPAELAKQLRTLERDGWLPPWPEWWPTEVLEELLPDPQLRTRFVSGCPRVPIAMSDEVQPAVPTWPEVPCGYLRLSAAYEDTAAKARAHGWPVIALNSHHLAMLTDSQQVVDALEELLAQLPSLRGEGLIDPGPPITEGPV